MGRRLNVPMIAAGVATVLCLAVVAGHQRIWDVPGLATLERTSVDARFRMRGGREPVDDRIVVVGIDDDTRRRHPRLTQTRHGWAQFIDALARYQPRVVALDFFFSSPERVLVPELAERVRDVHAELVARGEASAARDVLGEVVEELRGDERLAEAIGRAGNVYLGVMFTLGDRGQESEVPGSEGARYGDSVAAGGDNQPVAASGVTVSIAAIAEQAAGAGATNILVDDDGATRRVPLAIEHGGRHYLPLGAAAALALEGRPGDASYVGGRDHATIGGRRVPLGRAATAIVDYLGPGRTFPHVSAADVLDGTAPREALAGKLVFVGYTFGAFDKVATPYDQLLDGVEVHATLAHNLLHGELLAPAGRGVTLGAIAAIGAILTLLQLRRVRRRAWVPLVVGAAVVLAWIAIAHAAFVERRVVVELVAPLGAAAVIAIAGAATTILTEGREKARLRSAFSQYVSATLVERVLASPEMAHLGGERKTLSVLFSDIRGFSRLAEELDPERLAAFLNEYLTPMTEIVLDADGTLDKYIGDAVMAIWGAPVELADHATRACAAAVAMRARLDELNRRWRGASLPEVEIGVGINTGAMAVGNMGSEARFDYTVLGDAVNLAARLEGLTKEYGVTILVGEETARAAKGFVFRELDWVRVKGREGTAAVFELVTGPVEPHDLAAWNEALAAYRAGDFARAAERWGDLALRAPDDRAAQVMRDRAARLAAAPPPDGWDGVYDQLSK